MRLLAPTNIVSATVNVWRTRELLPYPVTRNVLCLTTLLTIQQVSLVAHGPDNLKSLSEPVQGKLSDPLDFTESYPEVFRRIAVLRCVAGGWRKGGRRRRGEKGEGEGEGGDWRVGGGVVQRCVVRYV